MAQFFVNQKCQRRNNQAFDQIKGHRAEKNVGVDAVDQGIHFVAGRHNRVNRHEFGVKRDDQILVGKRAYDRDGRRSG